MDSARHEGLKWILGHWPYLLVLLAVLAWPPLTAAFFGFAGRAVARLARRPGGVVLTAGLASLLVGLPLVTLHEPLPRVHDEFSYLLASDTFAHGRLTNPTPPAWQALETPHVLFRPSYQSKYPAGEGLMLAAGQALAGRPVMGAWLGAGLACAGIAWMLLALVPRRWALVGGLVAAVHPVLLYWQQSYWGGQIATLGGALLVGGAVRVDRRGARVWPAVAIGAGLALLSLARPAEGLLFSILVLAWLGYRLLRRGEVRADWRGLLVRLALPAACVVGPTLAWTGYYNYRVTGAALTPPYVEHIRQYMVAPAFTFLGLRPRTQTFYDPLHRIGQTEFEVGIWEKYQTPKGFALSVGGKFVALARDAVLSSLLVVPLVFALLGWRRSRLVRVAAVGLFGFLLIVMTTQVWTLRHYVAPAAGLLALLVVIGFRRLRAWHHGRGRAGLWGGGWGRVGARLVVVALLFNAYRATLDMLWGVGWYSEREKLVAGLEAGPDDHLILVRYAPGHSILHEWVANLADPPTQRVVFAQEVDEPLRSELIHAYASGGRRKVWLFEPDKDFFHLEPYPIEAGR